MPDQSGAEPVWQHYLNSDICIEETTFYGVCRGRWCEKSGLIFKKRQSIMRRLGLFSVRVKTV